MLILFRESFFFIDTKINCFTVRGKPKLIKILEEMNFFLTTMIIIDILPTPPRYCRQLSRRNIIGARCLKNEPIATLIFALVRV